ncbi:MAG: M23 family metallopeptidase [Gaiellaceae bacterium]
MRVRGALDFTPTYNDDFEGWPLAPIHRPHGVYGTFGNPTLAWASGMGKVRTSYHKAIDIPVNDARGPQPVFAIEGGVVKIANVKLTTTPLGERVRAGVVGVGHFRYAHIVSEVAVGERVDAGQRIGVTAPGWWHVHLGEWARHAGRRVMVNPLRPGGKLGPVLDRGRPYVEAIRFYPKADENNERPHAIRRERVRGVVVPVALAMDRFPKKSWPKAPVGPLHVYKASILLKRGNVVVEERTLFQLDSAPGPTWKHFFRPLTRRSAPVAVCAVRKPDNCAGRHWLRLSERGWDTRRMANGWYTLTVKVEDTVGRTARRTLRFRIAN